MAEIASLALWAPLVLSAGVVGVSWMMRIPRLAVLLLVIALVVGQLVRVVIPGQGGGILLSDIAVVLVVLSSSLRVIVRQPGKKFSIFNFQFSINRQFFNDQTDCSLLITRYGLLFIPFISWSLLTVFLNSWRYDGAELLIVLSYWARLTLHLALVPAFLVLLHDTKLARVAQKYFLAAISLIAGIGLFQVVFAPTMERVLQLPFLVTTTGWDPHQGRLFSTWLDPNFIGLFFGIGIFWIGAAIVQRFQQTKRVPIGLVLVLVLSILAFMLTESRSSFVAIGVTVLFLSLFLFFPSQKYSKHVFISRAAVSVSVLVIGALSFVALGDRAVGLITVDPTVQLRAESLQAVWPLAAEHAVFGVGYNGYQFSALEAGLIGNYSIHSRAGADNSILTLWVTTGILGVLLFVVPWMVLFSAAIRRWLLKQDVFSIAAAASIVAWFIHAQFVNSLLYSHIIIVMALIVTLSVSMSHDVQRDAV